MKIVTEPFDRRSWLEWRRLGIGGSDAAAICSMDPRKGPLAIYLDKVGLLPLEDREESEEMRWGRLLETAIADEFETQRGLHVGGRQLRAVHKTLPWIRATLDGFVYDSGDEEAEPIALLETKTASVGSRDWTDEDGEPTIPEHIEVQVQHQLLATDLQQAFVAVLLMWPTPRLRVMEVERDEHAIATLKSIEAAFWERVQRKDPPVADSYAETAAALRTAYAESIAGKSIEMTTEALQLVEERNAADRLERLAKDRKQRAENGLMAFLGEHEVGVRGGRPVLTWKSSSTRRIDTDRMRAEDPELANRFTKVTTSRRFTFKWKTIVSDGLGQVPEEE